MEFHDKIRELRKQRGITQEALAEALYVSRTAISKWESGRGYPNLDSLKAISAFFSVTIDELLSEEDISPTVEKSRAAACRHCDRFFALIDCSAILLFFLPLFGQTADGTIRSVSLAALSGKMPYLRAAYLAVVLGMAICGILTLFLQNHAHSHWTKHKTRLSFFLHTTGLFLFVLSRQPYAAAILLALLLIKTKLWYPQQ